jgi:hypothetical protein
MNDPTLPDNDALALAQRIAEECSEDHGWFHFTLAATLIEQFVAERLAAAEARVKVLEGEVERLREAFVEMQNHTDGHNWYWLSYGEKCYAFAVVAAFPFDEDVPYPPAGSYLTPHDEKERLWVAEDGTEMMVDENIAAIERQNGDVICKFIAQAYAHCAALARPANQGGEG